MAERSSAQVKGRPPEVRDARHSVGRVIARAHGWADGIFGSLETIDHELDRYKERAEEAGRRAAHWWADIARELEGECDSLENRLEGSRSDAARLETEVKDLKARFEQSRDSHDEGSWHDHDRELEFTRAEQRDLRDRLDRARAQRKHAYEMARTSAEQFKDYFEGLMRAYCAGNRKAGRRRELPKIELPQSLQKPTLDSTTPAPDTTEPPPPVQDERLEVGADSPPE